ncbi:MAG: pentapeptide repeat-containing protein [Candidatus Aenigmatarchaeota archaeon]
MTGLIVLKGSEWMKQLLDGERDFSRVKIVGGNMVLDYMKEINRYLSAANLEKEPLIFDRADISGVHAPAIYAPFTRLRGVRAPYANFASAYMEHSDFGPYVNANGSETCSILWSATLDNANMEHSIFRKARLKNASVKKTNFSHADLYGVTDWETMKMLGTVNDFDVKVDEYGHDMLARAKAHKILV